MPRSWPARATRTGWTWRRRTWTSGGSTARWPRAAPRAPRGEVAAAAYALALELYGGELLPEEGPAEWIVSRRDHYREAAVEAAGELASESMLAGDFGTAVRACRFGLEIDRYQDALWRMLIEARDRAGDTGAASRDRREYAAILEGLGVGGRRAASVGHA